MPITLQPGLVLANRYEALRELGAGGMGEVWCCFDRRLQREVALKRVRLRHAENSRLARKIQQFFIEEVRALASLSHPNLVRALDFGQLEDASPYLVMEFIDGLSLDHLWRREQILPWHLLAAIIDQLLAGLAHIHSRGILHRDLKPPNILLARGADDNLRVYLVDFGIAIVDHALDDFRPRTVLESQEVPTVGLGTPPYIAPEQVLSDVSYRGPSTDLHAVGVLLYQFSSGELPYWSEQLAKMIQNVATQPPPPLRAMNEAPPQLQGLLQRLLAKTPWHRGLFAASLRKALEPLWEPELAHREWLRLLWRRGESLTGSFDELGASSSREHEAAAPRSGDARALTPRAPGDGAVPMAGHGLPFEPTLSLREEGASSHTLPWGAVEASAATLVDALHESEQRLASSRLANPSAAGSSSLGPLAATAESQGLGGSLSLLSLQIPSVVGREQEQRWLWDEVEAVCEGARRMVVLWGPAGIGKSRLAQWLLEQTHEHGLLLGLKVRMSQGASQQAMGFLGALERHMALEGLERSVVQRNLEARWGKEPELQELIAGLTELMRPTPFAERTPQQLAVHRTHRRNQLLLKALEKLAEEEPLYLWLDDLQHTDDANAALIEQLLDHGPPLLMLATFQRTGDSVDLIPPALGEALKQARNMELAPLSDESLGRLLQGLLPLAPQTTTALMTGSHGNPLYLIQQLFHWLQQGQLLWDEGQRWYEAPTALREQLVESSSELWRQRIEALSEELQKACYAAATLGRTFSLALLEQLFERLSLPAGLGQELAALQLLHIEREHCAWSHELIEVYVRERLRAYDDATAIFLTAAQLLKEHPLHFTRRMVRLRIDALVQGGAVEEACDALFAFLGDAWQTRRDARQLREDLALLPAELPAAYQAHRARWEAEAALLSSAHDEAEQAAHRALEAYESQGDGRGVVEARRILGAIAAGRSRYLEAMRWLNQALEDARQLDLPETIAQILLLLAHTHQFMSRLHESAQFAREAYTLAEQWNINTVLVQSCLIQATTHHDLGEHTEARLWAEISLDACRLGGELYGEGQAHILLGWLDIIDGRYEHAIGHCDAAADCFRELAEWWWLTSAALTRGWALCWQGDFDDASGIAEDTRAAFTRHQMPHETGQTWLLTAAVLLRQDAVEEAAEALLQAREGQRPEPMMRQPLALLDAWLAQRQGRAGEAQHELRRAITIWQQLGLTTWGVPSLLHVLAAFSWPDELRGHFDAWRMSFS